MNESRARVFRLVEQRIDDEHRVVVTVFLANDKVRAIVTKNRPVLDADRCMARGSIVLARLSKGAIGEDDQDEHRALRDPHDAHPELRLEGEAQLRSGAKDFGGRLLELAMREARRLGLRNEEEQADKANQ